MLTPKQLKLLNQPNIQEIVQELQLEPTTSEAYKFSIQVKDRITNWSQAFEKVISLPVVKRSVSYTGISSFAGHIAPQIASIEVVYTYKAWKCISGKSVSCPF